MPYIIGFLALIGLGTLITGVVFVAAMLLADVREHRARKQDAAQQSAALAAYVEQYPAWQGTMSTEEEFYTSLEYALQSHYDALLAALNAGTGEAVDGQAGESL